MPSDKPVIKAHVHEVVKRQFAELAIEKRMTESQLLRRIISDYMKKKGIHGKILDEYTMW